MVTKVSDLREEEMDSQVKTGRRLLLLGIAGSVLWLLADIVLGYLPGGIAKAGYMSGGALTMFAGLFLFLRGE